MLVYAEADELLELLKKKHNYNTRIRLSTMDSTQLLSRAMILFCILFIGLIGCVNGEKEGEGTSVRDGGFKRLVVSISNDIPENQDIIDNLKDILSNASAALYEATSRRFYLADVTINIPTSWNETSANTSSTFLTETATILLESNKTGLPPGPTVKQGRKCGEAGEFMLMPETYVKMDDEEREKKFGDTGKTVAHEFAHLRWGVFDEYVLPDKTQFYVDTNNQPQPNTCTRGLQGKWKKRGSKEECDPDPVKKEEGELCMFSPETEAETGSAHAYASVMGFHFVNHVTKFCDDAEDTPPEHKHNDEAHNEQNQYCDRRSIMQVIRDFHPEDLADLRTVNASEKPPETNFNVVREKDHEKYIFIIEPIKIIGREKVERENVTRQLITSFLKFVNELSDPQNTYIELRGLTCSDYYVKRNESTYTTSEKRTALMNDISTIFDSHWNNTNPNGVFCPKEPGYIGRATSGYNDALTYAIENKTEGSNVILVSFGGRPTVLECRGTEDARYTEVQNQYAIPFTLNFIRPPFKTTQEFECLPILKEIVRKSGGQYIDMNTTNILDIREIPPSIPHSKAASKRIHMFREKKQLTNGSIQGSILVEEGLQDGVITFVGQLFYEENITVATPDGNKTKPKHVCSEDETSCEVQLNGTMQAGNWTYVLNNVNVDFTVAFSARPTAGFVPITMTTSINAENINFDPNASLEDKLLVIKAEVNQAFNPVIKADVIATVSQGSVIMQLNLSDDGIGADSRKGDGIYAAYFTKFQSDEDVHISASIDNSQSLAKVAAVAYSKAFDPNVFEVPVPPDPPQPADPFFRYSALPPVTVQNHPGNGSDLYPPARVIDLVVLALNHSERHVQVQFTVTGDDMLEGTATSYEFRHATTSSQLRNNFADATLVKEEHYPAGFPKPDEPRTVERFLIHIPPSANNTADAELKYFLAMRVFDEVDQGSEVSNLAQFSFLKQKFIPGSTIPGNGSTTPGGQATTSADEIVDIGEDNILGSRLVMIGGICGAILALVIVIIIILACCFCNPNCRRRGRDKSDARPSIEIHMHEQHGGYPGPAGGGYPAGPPPSYYDDTPSNRPAKAMRSTVRRELEEINELPAAPPPPPPRPRGPQVIWNTIKGTTSRFRHQVQGAFNNFRESRFYHGGQNSPHGHDGHVSQVPQSYNTHPQVNQYQQHQQDGNIFGAAPPLPDKTNPRRNNPLLNNANEQSAGQSKMDWRSKQSGKYTKKIEPVEDEGAHEISFRQASGKYNPSIIPLSLPDKQHPTVFPKPPKMREPKGKIPTPLSTLEFPGNSGDYDDVMSPGFNNIDSEYYDDVMLPRGQGHVNPSFLGLHVNPTSLQPDNRGRGASNTSDETYTYARNSDFPTQLSIRSDNTYTDGMSPQLSPNNNLQYSPISNQHTEAFHPQHSPRYQGYGYDNALQLPPNHGQQHPSAQNPQLSPSPRGYDSQQHAVYGQQHLRNPQYTESGVYDDTMLPPPRQQDVTSALRRERPQMNNTKPNPATSHYPQGLTANPADARGGGDDSFRISRSSFYDDIEKEQAAAVAPSVTSNQPNVFTKAKRIGFNYMAQH